MRFGIRKPRMIRVEGSSGTEPAEAVKCSEILGGELGSNTTSSTAEPSPGLEPREDQHSEEPQILVYARLVR